MTNVNPKNAVDTSVSWSLKNISGKASINSYGLIEAYLDGIVHAYAIANDLGGAEDSIEISISNQYNKVDSIDIYSLNNKYSFFISEKNVQFYVDVYPEYASNKTVSWEVEESTGKASVSSEGLLTFLNPGLVQIHATSFDNNKAKNSKTVEIKENSSVDINLNNSYDILVYPNPSTEEIKIKYTTAASQNISIAIINLTGEIVFFDNLINDNKTIDLNIEFLEPGIYFLKIMDGNKIYSTKFIQN